MISLLNILKLDTDRCTAVAFLCVLNVFERLGWGGVGHVNVPCTLHTCWMLRNWRVWVGWFELVVCYWKLLVRTALSLQTETQPGAQKQPAYSSDMWASTIRTKSLCARTARKKVRKVPRWLEHKCRIVVGKLWRSSLDLTGRGK